MAENKKVDTNKMFELQDKVIEKIRFIQKNEDGFLEALEALLKASPEQLKAFADEVFKKKPPVENFIVGEEFQNKNKGHLVQYCFGGMFTEFWKANKEKLISFSDWGKNNLKDYVLSKNMKDMDIKHATNSPPIEENMFWLILYFLTKNQILGKKFLNYQTRKHKTYIFHVNSLSLAKILSVHIDQNEQLIWSFRADEFGKFGWWDENRIYLYYEKNTSK